MLQIHEKASTKTQEVLEFRHWKEPTSETMSWLYYRTLASAVQNCRTRSPGYKVGSAKTVATKNADETASESESDHDCMTKNVNLKQPPKSIPADEEDALWGEPGLRAQAVDTLLADWTTLNEHQIIENKASALPPGSAGYRTSFDRTIKATLREINEPRRSRGHKYKSMTMEHGVGGNKGSRREQAIHSAFSGLHECQIQLSGEILDNSGIIIGKLIRGDPAKIGESKAVCDEDGNIWCGIKKVGKAIAVTPTNIQTGATRPPAPEASEAIPPPLYADVVLETADRRVENATRYLATTGHDLPSREHHYEELAAVTETNSSKAEVSGSATLTSTTFDERPVDEDDGWTWTPTERKKKGKKAKAMEPAKENVAPSTSPTADHEEKSPSTCGAETPEGLSSTIETAEPSETGHLSSLSALENLRIEADGAILNLDGVVVGWVMEGDAKRFASMMYCCDAKGNVVDYVGKSVGKVVLVRPPDSRGPKRELSSKNAESSDALKSLPVKGPHTNAQAHTRAPETHEVVEDNGTVEGAVEDDDEPRIETHENMPCSNVCKVKDLKIDRFGDILDINFVVIARLIEGDAKMLARAGAICDAEGKIWIGDVIVKDAKIEMVEDKSTMPPPAVPDAQKPCPAPMPSVHHDLGGRTNKDKNDANDTFDEAVTGGTNKHEAIEISGKKKKGKARIKSYSFNDQDSTWGNPWGPPAPKTKKSLLQTDQTSNTATTGEAVDATQNRKSVKFWTSDTHVQPSAPLPSSSLSMRSVSTYSGFDQAIYSSDSECDEDEDEEEETRETERMRHLYLQHQANTPAKSRRRIVMREARNPSERLRYSGLPLSQGTGAFNPYYAVMPYQPSGLYPPISGYYGQHFPPRPPGSALGRAPEPVDDRIAPVMAQLQALQQQVVDQGIARESTKGKEELKRLIKIEAKVKAQQEEEAARAKAQQEVDQVKRRVVNLEQVERFILKQNEKALQLEARAQAAEEAAHTITRELADLERKTQEMAKDQQQALRAVQEDARRLSSIAVEAEQVASSKQAEAMKLAQGEAEHAAKMFADCKGRLEAEISAREKAEHARTEAQEQVQELRVAHQKSASTWAGSNYTFPPVAIPPVTYPEQDSSSISSSEDSSSTITDTATETTETTPQTRSGIIRVSEEDLESDPSQMIIFPSRMGWKEHEYKVLTRSMLRFGFRPLVEEGAETPCVPSQFYERPGSGGCALRGTALWHPPGPSLASDVYTSFLKTGWKPSYVRSNGKLNVSLNCTSGYQFRSL